MQETPEELQQLQELMDRSIERAGSFLRSSFEMPEHSLSAGQFVRYLQGIQVVALATTTARGEPRVAPIGSLFVGGRFYIPTVATAARTQQIKRNSAISLTHFSGTELAIIVHGYATVVWPDDPRFTLLEDLHREYGDRSVLDWGEGVYLQIDAAALYTYAKYPEHYPV